MKSIVTNVQVEIDIPANIKIVKKEIAEPMTNCTYSSMLRDSFPDELKIADIVPAFKKQD